MRRHISLALPTFAMLMLFAACKKDSPTYATVAARANQYINASVASGENFIYFAGNTGSLAVSRQAEHFRTSETKTQNGSVIYSYSSAPGYTGSDEVSLVYSPIAAKAESNSGCPANHNDATSSLIVIKLTVTK